MPSQFERRKERYPINRTPLWVAFWVSVILAGVVTRQAYDVTAGTVVIAVGVVGFFLLGFRHGVWDITP